MLHLRKKRVFPQQLSDTGAFIFVVVMIPFTYIYEVQIVLPTLYSDSLTSYICHMIFGAFLLVNLIGNFLGLWLTDTSTRYVVLPSTVKNNTWKLCVVCEAVTPPRAWHCNACNVCILKREHHCMFVGYCVGHQNHRYFCLFLLYMWLSVIYCSYFNTLFLAQHVNEVSWPQVVKFIFPLFIIITGIDFSWIQLYIFFWSVHFAVVLLTTVLVAYHANLVLHGRTTFESNRRVDAYNLGWKQNVIEVLGARWKIAIFWPFVASPLPHNGVEWDTSETWKQEGPKNR